jgi:uncharacterized membrane protein YgcG
VTDDDLGFTAADDELGRRLRAAAPAGADTDATLVALRPRFERARRRRRAVVSTAGALGVAALVMLGVAVIGPGGGADVETPPATEPRVTTTAPTVPTVPTTIATVPLPGGTAPGGTTATSDDHGGDDDSGGDDNSGSGSSSGSGSGTSDD